MMIMLSVTCHPLAKGNLTSAGFSRLEISTRCIPSIPINQVKKIKPVDQVLKFMEHNQFAFPMGTATEPASEENWMFLINWFFFPLKRSGLLKVINKCVTFTLISHQGQVCPSLSLSFKLKLHYHMCWSGLSCCRNCTQESQFRAICFVTWVHSTRLLKPRKQGNFNWCLSSILNQVRNSSLI